MALRSVEEQIRAARERGEFDKLKNRGKRLDHSEYFSRPEHLRLGAALLKNAGFVPQEVELQHEVGQLKEELEATHDPAERKRLGREIQRKRVKIDFLLRSYKR